MTQLSKGQFKKVVEKQINRKSYLELSESRKSKGQDILKSLKPNKIWKIPMQEYLKSNQLTTAQKKHLFYLRSFSYDLKSNYKNQFGDKMSCRICEEDGSIENEFHTFFACKVLLKDMQIPSDLSFDHIFGHLEEQIRAIQYFSLIMKRRDPILKLKAMNGSTT